MCRLQAVDYEPSVHVVPQARHWLQHRLRRWELDPLISDGSLLLTELVTNAVLHASSQVHVAAAVADGTLEIGVGDHDPRPPRLRRGERDLLSALSLSHGGRGIRLVDQIAEEWGWVSLSAGKQIWFRLSVGDGWPHRTACPCAGENLERVRLESGKFAVAVAGPWDAD